MPELFGLNPFFIRASARTWLLLLGGGLRRVVSIPSSSGQALEQPPHSRPSSWHTSQSLLHQGKRSNLFGKQELDAGRRGLNPFFIRASARTHHVARPLSPNDGLNPFFIRASARTRISWQGTCRCQVSIPSSSGQALERQSGWEGRYRANVSIPSSSGQALELTKGVARGTLRVRVSIPSSSGQALEPGLMGTVTGYSSSQSLLHQGKRSNPGSVMLKSLEMRPSQSLLHQGKRSNSSLRAKMRSATTCLNPFFIRASARTDHCRL